MGVRIRKRRGKWYVFVNYQGRRKAKCLGTRDAAEKVKKVLEAKLALGDLGFMSEGPKQLTFEQYADKWLKEYADNHLKSSTAASYRQLLRLYVKPRFGATPLKQITRDSVKSFLSDMAAKLKQPRNEGEE